jgi:predicted O-linked N-acetylglucosamine transferase (SPINDLY family)
LRIQTRQLGEAAARESLTARFARLGVEAARLSLHPGVARDAYLAAHGEIDMILDTFPFPGGTTTCEALWMGVPTLTLAGDRMLSRQGASILSAAGLADWVAADERAYETLAVTRARDLAALAKLRTRLREDVAGSALFDARRFAQHFSTAMSDMWTRFQQAQN